jgi:hypothetical protein
MVVNSGSKFGPPDRPDNLDLREVTTWRAEKEVGTKATGIVTAGVGTSAQKNYWTQKATISGTEKIGKPLSKPIML